MAITVLESPAAITAPGGTRRVSHYVLKNRIVDAIVEGTELTALCGFKWVPSRDPVGIPVCPDCRRIYDALPGGV